jgi:hypothetical protein
VKFFRKRSEAEIFVGGETNNPLAETDAKPRRRSLSHLKIQLAEFVFFTVITLIALGFFYLGFDILVVAGIFLFGVIVKLIFNTFKG